MSLLKTKNTKYSDAVKAEFHTPILIEINNHNNKIIVHLAGYVSESDFDSGKERISTERITIDMNKFDAGQFKFMEDIEEFIDDLLLNGSTLVEEKEKTAWTDSTKKRKEKTGKDDGGNTLPIEDPLPVEDEGNGNGGGKNKG